MTNYNERLDEILHQFFVNAPQYDDDISVKKAATAKANAKQAILDWRNKQLEELLDRVETHYWPYDVGYYIPLSAIEAERNKLNNPDGDVK